MTTASIPAGDFSTLAEAYNESRPGYAENSIHEILQLIATPNDEITFADIGAGTGIWTRQVNKHLHIPPVAVEPNDAMRLQGSNHPDSHNIIWQKGSAEDTKLNTNSFDLVTMASSFHWTDFDKSLSEFNRILKPGGWFVAAWNPRAIQHPLLKQFEEKIKQLAPNIKRVSSGKSNFVENLTKRLQAVSQFHNFHYIEHQHSERFNKQRYISVWQSVNDVRNQLGEDKFQQFMDYIDNHFTDDASYECLYITRAWAIQKK